MSASVSVRTASRQAYNPKTYKQMNVSEFLVLYSRIIKSQDSLHETAYTCTGSFPWKYIRLVTHSEGLRNKQDEQCCIFFPFQLTLIVYDSAYPDSQDTAQVQIPMQRNLNPPVLNDTNYVVTIPESQPAGVAFFTAISASDADGVSVLCPLPLVCWSAVQALCCTLFFSISFCYHSLLRDGEENSNMFLVVLFSCILTKMTLLLKILQSTPVYHK